MVDTLEKDTKPKDTTSGQIIATQDSNDVSGSDKIQYISEEVHQIINRDLAEGQLEGDYHSRNKYHLDGSCEINLWENERCQVASCNCHTELDSG